MGICTRDSTEEGFFAISHNSYRKFLPSQQNSHHLQTMQTMGKLSCPQKIHQHI